MANTSEQQLAIDTITRNVSVSAGAGSGKTAVLKQRFLHILEASKERVDKSCNVFGKKDNFYDAATYDGVKSSNIVGITFTRKAAGEIKTRIREAMLDAMNNGDEFFWRMQLRELEKAQINTIHGLCARILRENPVEANLDPNFVISEEIDYEAFREKCIHDFILKSLLDQESNSVKILTSILGSRYLHNQLSSLAGSFESIAQEKDIIAPYKESALALQDKIDALKNKLEWLVNNRGDLVKKTTKAYQALEEMGSDLPMIFARLDAIPCDLSLADMHLSMRPSGNLTAEIREARDMSAQIKACQIDVQAIPLMEHWQDLIKKLCAYMEEKKNAANIFTYDDLEDRAIDLLQNNEEVRHKYHKKYQYFMVDEFQDTNKKQCTLIYLLCGDENDRLTGNKLFVVGDPKQSIYRFRGANVDVFREVQMQVEETGGENISMKTNFRSKDKILDCCNETFAKVMGNPDGAVCFEPLDCADFNKDYDILPELIRISPEEENARTVELYAVAQKIRTLVDAELTSKEYIPGSRIYGKMAILLRSMTRVNELAEVLTEYHIPYVVVDGKGFFQRQEVNDILDLWDILQNPYQNIPFAAVLKSPYFSFDDEVLTRVALRGDYLCDNLQEIDEEFLNELSKVQLIEVDNALRKLKILKSSIPYLDVDSAWSKLWDVCEVDAVLAVHDGGKQKLANIKKLRRMCLEYCHEQGVGIAEWLDYIKNAKAIGAEETNANLETTDAVQIMTIHKSKGLEFKRVFLPFLGGRSHTDSRSIVYAEGVGFGIQLMNSKGEFVKTSVFDAIKAAEKAKDREERQRILYVAMTRAEEELYMFGISGKEQKNLDEANWMDQLGLVFDGYPGVIKTDFSSEDIAVPQEDDSEDFYTISEEVKNRIEPLPNYNQSGRKLFTATALTHYLYCQRQYFYEEYMGLPGLEEQVISENGEMPAHIMGSIIHEALEKYNGKDNLAVVFKNAVKKYAPGANANRAWKILVDYINSGLFKSIPQEQLHEKEFLIEVDDLVFKGFIDVLATNADGTMSIIDYKTGEPPKLGDEELGYMYQLAIYKYAAEKIIGRKVAKAELHFLQSNSPFVLERENAFGEAVNLAKEISAKSKEEEFTCNLESCKHCSYNYLCKKE